MSRHPPVPSVQVAFLTDDVRRALAAARSPFLAVAAEPAGGGWHVTVLDTATTDVDFSADVSGGEQWRPATVENTLWHAGFITLPGAPWTLLATGRRCAPAYATGPRSDD